MESNPVVLGKKGQVYYWSFFKQVRDCKYKQKYKFEFLI